MKKKEIQMMLDTVIMKQDRLERELKMLRNALEEFRFKESIKQNKSEFEVMNFE